MAVAFNTKMMLAACVLIALVAAIDEADATAIPGQTIGGYTQKPTREPTRAPTKSPTRKPTRAPTNEPTEKQVCCDSSVDIQGCVAAKSCCVFTMLPKCLKCPTGSNTSTWIQTTNTSTSVTLSIPGYKDWQGNDVARITSKTGEQNVDQIAVISADKKCYGILRSVKLSMKLPGPRGKEPVAHVNFAQAGLCKKGTGENPDQCAAAKTITSCRVETGYSDGEDECAAGDKAGDSKCNNWLKYPKIGSNTPSDKFMTGDKAYQACYSDKTYTSDTTTGRLFQLCSRKCQLARYSTTSDKLSSTGCPSHACTSDEEGFVATAI